MLGRGDKPLAPCDIVEKARTPAYNRPAFALVNRGVRALLLGICGTHRFEQRMQARGNFTISWR
jgi:hypothetical protein